MGRSVPSFFLMKKKGEAIGDFESLMRPDARFSSMNASNCTCSSRDKGYTLPVTGLNSGVSSIVWSHGRCSGRLSNDSFAKTSLKDQYTCGTRSLNVDGDLAFEEASLVDMISANMFRSFCKVRMDIERKERVSFFLNASGVLLQWNKVRH